MKRICQVIGVKSERCEEYIRLHENIWPHIIKRLKERNITNYTIFNLDGMLVQYFEYVGNDFEADMNMPDDEIEQKWHALCISMQESFSKESNEIQWLDMKSVFHMN